VGKRIYFAPLGCAKNQVDGEIMLGRALAIGHTLTDDPEAADVLVVNTCAFIEDARRESIGRILELAAIREKGGGKRLVVTGCMAERYGADLSNEMPEIDALVGTGALDRFTEAMESRGGALFRAGPHTLPSAAMERHIADMDGSAYLKVSEGCDHECSFCVIPHIRGRHRSRTIADVAAEARALASRGIVEVNLVAQDLSAYGRDLGLRDGLASLLHALGDVEGLARVRCLYLYPNTIDESALDAMRDVGNVCAYVDMPLQHADAGMLRAMRRGGNADSLGRLLDKIRGRMGDPVVRSTFIVGFPGETDRAFDELCRFVETISFDRIAVFRYSPEDGSAAAELDGRVPALVSEYRRDALLDIQEGISERRAARFVGRTEAVLVCGRDESGSWHGRTGGQAPEIDGQTLFGPDAAGLRPGQLVDAEITGSDAHDLFAVPVERVADRSGADFSDTRGVDAGPSRH
jgi:ribosomal protein S12 methylthiotransferase